MTTFRAHYDGKVIVPDEPVDLPLNESLEVQLRPTAANDLQDLSMEERLKRLKKVTGHISGVVLPEEAFNRKTMYEAQP
jgi:hypothetical protein